MKTTKQPEIDPITVRVKMWRLGVNATFLARRHNVSKPSATRALQGVKSQRRLLGKFAHSLDVIEAQREAARKKIAAQSKTASNKLRAIDNAKFERRAAPVAS